MYVIYRKNIKMCITKRCVVNLPKKDVAYASIGKFALALVR